MGNSSANPQLPVPNPQLPAPIPQLPVPFVPPLAPPLTLAAPNGIKPAPLSQRPPLLSDQIDPVPKTNSVKEATNGYSSKSSSPQKSISLRAASNSTIFLKKIIESGQVQQPQQPQQPQKSELKAGSNSKNDLLKKIIESGQLQQLQQPQQPQKSEKQPRRQFFGRSNTSLDVTASRLSGSKPGSPRSPRLLKSQNQKENQTPIKTLNSDPSSTGSSTPTGSTQPVVPLKAKELQTVATLLARKMSGRSRSNRAAQPSNEGQQIVIFTFCLNKLSESLKAGFCGKI